MHDRYIESVLRDGGWITFTHWSTSWSLYNNRGACVRQGSTLSKFTIAARSILSVRKCRDITTYHIGV